MLAFNRYSKNSLNLTVPVRIFKIAFWLEAYIRILIVDMYKNRKYAFKLTLQKSLSLTVAAPMFSNSCSGLMLHSNLDFWRLLKMTVGFFGARCPPALGGIATH